MVVVWQQPRAQPLGWTRCPRMWTCLGCIGTMLSWQSSKMRTPWQRRSTCAACSTRPARWAGGVAAAGQEGAYFQDTAEAELEGGCWCVCCVAQPASCVHTAQPLLIVERLEPADNACSPLLVAHRSWQAATAGSRWPGRCRWCTAAALCRLGGTCGCPVSICATTRWRLMRTSGERGAYSRVGRLGGWCPPAQVT